MRLLKKCHFYKNTNGAMRVCRHKFAKKVTFSVVSDGIIDTSFSFVIMKRCRPSFANQVHKAEIDNVEFKNAGCPILDNNFSVV
ncbi:hypothetical protein DCMF_06705 [Candidatus Formimonas warabiya]|uniref:Uncharacterized protein n=1 Tax=Formimonas warabiya TaxID=1761012 RepID=A0A3G1KPX3_FORW1|nr:hypothetical protein DCMF_06705 [Candidatus Formimonas warabiya]